MQPSEIFLHETSPSSHFSGTTGKVAEDGANFYELEWNRLQKEIR